MRPRALRLGSFTIVAAMLSTIIAFTGSTAVAEVVICQDANAQGCWTAPFSEGGLFDAQPPQTVEEAGMLPTAVSAAVTPKGRIVYWDGLSGLEDSNTALALDAGRTADPDRTRVLDLSGASPLWIDSGVPEGENLFCADQRLLASGKVIVAGGTKFETEEYADLPDDGNGPDGLAELYGSKQTRLFTDSAGEGTEWAYDPAAEKNMKYGRWYPTLITQPDGNLLVAGGVSKLLWNSSLLPGDAGARASDPLPHNVNQTETYDRATGTWSENENGSQTLPLYARLHLLPNGKIWYPGVGQMWSPAGAAMDELEWNFYHLYDPATKTWQKNVGRGALGARSGAFSTMLRLDPDANGEYTKAEFVIGGGTIGVSPSTYVGTQMSERVTWTKGADGTWTVAASRTTDMANRRWYSSGVLLPNNTVLAFSGADKDEVIAPGTEVPVRQVEWFDPNAQTNESGRAPGRWLPLSEAQRDRTYHNSAVLLPDGSVLVGGHAPINQLYGGQGNGANDDSHIFANNLRDPSFERYYPPYLYNGPRPKITANSAATYGGSLNVTPATDSVPVAEIVLTRLPSVTHTTDADQRSVKVNFTPSGSGTLQAAIPNDPSILPPGYYYVFAMSEQGVPSIAPIVKIDYEVTTQGISQPVDLGQQPVRDAAAESETTSVATAPGAVADAPVASVVTESARTAARTTNGGSNAIVWVALGTLALLGIAARTRALVRTRA